MSLNRNPSCLAILMLFITLTASIGRADTVYMKDGAVRQGRIVSEDDKEVVLEATAKAEKADLHIPKANIARIEREKDEQRPPAPTDPMKESERLAKELAEYYTKARMNAPAKFEYEYEAAPDDEGIFRFKDQGRQWRYRSDLCIGYCEKAMETGRKRLALLKKSPDTPKLKEDVQSTKAIIVQIYAFEQKVLASRGRKGRGGDE